MGYFWTERLKEVIGSDKAAAKLYQLETGKNINQLYIDTFHGDNKQKGTLFEFYIFKHLYKIKGYHRFLFNVYLPSKNGITEVDVIFIHEKGVFDFECKNYSGSIYGKQDSFKWTQYFNNRKNSFFNPIKQNEIHIHALKDIIDIDKKNYLSFIVFNDRSKLKIEYDPYRLLVDNATNTIIELKKVLKKLAVCFSKDDIDKMYNLLMDYSHVSQEVKKQHINHIQNKYR